MREDKHAVTASFTKRFLKSSPSKGKEIEADSQDEEHHFELEAPGCDRMNVFGQQPFNVAKLMSI